MWGLASCLSSVDEGDKAEVSSRLLNPSFAEIESMSAESQHELSITTSDRFLLPAT